jgi:hypothetical protein
MCGFSRMVSWTLLGAKGVAIAAGKAQDDIEQWKPTGKNDRSENTRSEMR